MPQKKKLIFYGVRNIDVRREAEFFLDDNYEIIGYSDGHYDHDILDGKRFFLPSELKDLDYDYILILSRNEKTVSNIKSDLLALGLPPEKIIQQTMGGLSGQLDLVGDIEKHYAGESGLIFGLSYSLVGIYEKKLCIPFYNLSWHSLGLYYNYRLFQFMIEHGLISTVNRALLVFAYNFLDFDLSRSLRNFQGGFPFAVWRLNDWHNYRQEPRVKEYIENYRMFGRKFSNFYQQNRYHRIRNDVYSGAPHMAEIKKSFFSNYTATIAENREIFTCFYEELRSHGIHADFVVPPYYVDGFNRVSLEAVQQKRKSFYSFLHETCAGIQIFDYFDLYAQKREFFYDLYHLNDEGANDFTEIINKEILGI